MLKTIVIIKMYFTAQLFYLAHMQNITHISVHNTKQMHNNLSKRITELFSHILDKSWTKFVALDQATLKGKNLTYCSSYFELL